MRSCIAVFYIATFVTSALSAASPAFGAAAMLASLQSASSAPIGSSSESSDPDTLYRNRTNLDHARAAFAAWDARLTTNPGDFDAAWKLARAAYFLGSRDLQPVRRKTLERGVVAGRQASALEPRRPEGYFWLAAAMGELAQSHGLRQGLKYRGDIKQALETVLRLDPAFLQGSADRALGRWYFKVPGLFGGSNKKSEQHLRASLAYNENSIITHFFLAETLFELDRDAEARAALQKVLALPIDPEWEAEERDFKRQAKERLGP